MTRSTKVRRFIRQRRWAAYVLLLGSSFASSCAWGQSLETLFLQAVQSDPTYLGVQTGLGAAEARRGQARAALLPQITANLSSNDNQREYKTKTGQIPTLNDGYNNNTAQITLTQPVWRHANIIGLHQSASGLQQAQHQFSQAEQELFIRLTTAWFELLAARDAVWSQGLMVQAQYITWRSMLRGSEQGLVGAPQAEEARSKFEMAQAEHTAAESDFHLKQAALEQILGAWPDTQKLPQLASDYKPAAMEPSRLDDWLTLVDTRNPALLAAMASFNVSADEVRKQRAGHEPTLDLQASYGKNSQQIGGFPGQAGYDIKTATIGLQLQLPIYSGGAQTARVDEAVAQKEKARHEMESARRNSILAAKQAWYGWLAARAKLSAGEQAVRAGLIQIKAAMRGVSQEIKTEADERQAEANWASAVRDWRKAAYDEILTRLKLKAAAGLVAQDVLREIDSRFQIEMSVKPPQQEG